MTKCNKIWPNVNLMQSSIHRTIKSSDEYSGVLSLISEAQAKWKKNLVDELN